MHLIDYFPRLRSRLVHYVIAVASIALAALCFFYAKEVVHSPYVIVFMAGVGISSLFGVGPGVAGLILAVAVTDLFFIAPIGRPSLNRFTWIAASNYIGAFVLARLADRFVRRSGRDQKLKLALYYLFGGLSSEEQTGGGPDMHGRLDGIYEGEIYGWAFDRNHPSVPGKLSIYVDGRLTSEILAVHYRSDVGQRAFYHDLTQCCGARSKACVEVKFADGKLIANSPLIVEIPRRDVPKHQEAVLFMHIAKTAGTAFREAMVDNYKQSEVAYLYPDPPGFLPGHFELLPLEQRARFRLVIGHFQYGVHTHFPQETTYVTIVRDPTERVISHYYYLLETQPEITKYEDSSLSLVEMLERGITVNLDNLMVRCFAGTDEKDVPPGRVDQGVYELALHHLKTRFSYVGYQDKLSDAYKSLRDKLNWKPHPSLEIVNRGARPGRCDEGTRKAIEHFNRWDWQLYSEIRQLFP